MSNIVFDRVSHKSFSEIDYKDSLFGSDLIYLINLNNLQKPTTTEKNIENCMKFRHQIDDDDYDDKEFNFFNEEEDNNNIRENSNCLLSQKTERNNNEITNNINVETNQEKEKLNDIKKSNKDIKYRHDYYKMKFKTTLLKFLKNKLNKLIDNIKLCQKFGKHYIHTPNRQLYGGNPKEKDNREFIYKTVEDVFIAQDIQREEEKTDENNIDEEEITNLQKANEIIFNKIKSGICLNKSENSEKYKEQSDAIEILKDYLKKTIKEILNDDEFYSSEEFGEFRSLPQIKIYDNKFKEERNRNLSLLEKGNFVRLVEMPYYSNKNK